jgi:acyl-CoA thioesterase-1
MSPERPGGVTADQPARAAAPPGIAQGPKIVFLGDSISAGLHLSEDQAFPAVLQRKLSARGLPFQLVNAGVSGDTSAGGLRRVDWLLKQKPQLLVLELGANDGLRGLSLESTERDLRGIVAKARAHGTPVLLLGMRLPPSYGPDYVAGFEALFQRLADEQQLAFVPFFMNGVAGVPALNLEDGIHPTVAGHERLADNVLPALEAELRKLGPAPQASTKATQ